MWFITIIIIMLTGWSGPFGHQVCDVCKGLQQEVDSSAALGRHGIQRWGGHTRLIHSIGRLPLFLRVRLVPRANLGRGNLTPLLGHNSLPPGGAG